MTKYRTEITGHGELVWSTNAIEYDTVEEAKKWLDGLSLRFTGYDASRIVETTVPRGERFDPNDNRIYQNYK